MSQPDASLEQLANAARLEDIFLSRIEARREGTSGGQEGVDLQMAFEKGVPPEGEAPSFRYRLQARIENPEGFAEVEVISAFSLPRESSYLLEDPDTMLSFGNEVALMAAVPYLRQGIADVTARVLGSAALLPLLRRGELQFQRDPDGDATTDES